MSVPKRLPVRGDGYVSPPSDRPSYVVCILTPYGPEESKQHSICGYYVRGWAPPPFLDIDHAFCERNNGGRLLVCRDCARIVRAQFKLDADDER